MGENMSLSKYFRECSGHQESFEDKFLNEENIKQIYNALKAKDWTVEDWHKWRIDNSKLMYDFFIASDSKRKKTKKFQESYWLLIYAQQYIYEEANTCLSIAMELEQQQGLSYKKMCVEASKIFNEFCSEQVLDDWILNDYEIPSPFVEHN